MKILFFISAHGRGHGGHNHSLNHISRALAEKHDISIYSIGPAETQILQRNPFFKGRIYYNGTNLLHLRRKLKGIIKDSSPDIVHCFDKKTYNVVRLFLSSRKTKIVVNKCGGQNPVRFPFVPNLILFSEENYEWFKQQKKFSSSNIKVIPNRVVPLEMDKKEKPIPEREQSFNLVRICRITKYYEKSIQDSFRLLEELNNSDTNRPVHLFLIGNIEDQELYQRILMHPYVQSGQVSFITNPEYTSEASKLLYLADAVIGTGRGLMEAASLGLPILAISSTSKLPVLLNTKGFETALKTNFSERNVFSSKLIDNNLHEIIQLINNSNTHNQYRDEARSFFDKYLNIKGVILNYTNFYYSTIFSKRRIMRDAKLILRSIKVYHARSK